MACFGYCVRERAGAICPADFRHTKSAIGRFQEWNKDGTLKRVIETLAEDLHTRGGLDLSGCFIDDTFVVDKKGAHEWERPSGAEARSSWQWQMALVFLSPPTRNLLRRMKSDAPEQILRVRFTDERPRRLIGDKAYDSDPLDANLAQFETEMIAPHKANRKRTKTQDGRKLRRCKRRWKIECLFAWLQNFRRVLVRFDYHDVNYLGFVYLACIVILLRNYF